ncbi:MAG: class II D-tagatose-bisphosphate aldolase non-catalytic subunit, partial [Spirochaetales bacterium]
HSTDYQSARALKEMAEDGIAILKVGPALTFGLREGLFALSYMEKILVPEKKRANVIETLEKNMLKNPGNWINHYHGTGDELRVKRMFSYSDRCRYYLTQPELVSAIEKLFENMDIVDIPIGMLHQFMPYQYFKVRDGRLAKNPRSLVKDCVVAIIEDYNHASKFGYEIANTRIC